jgi:hypothetical protein
MSFDRFYPTYGTDDGVTAGNTDLRVANSTNDRSTWTGFTQTSYPHTTDLTNPPTQIKPDSLSPAVNLASGTGAIYIALARLTGTTTNTLGGSSAVLEEEGIPARFFVAQNYPNPFNPSTSIEYGLPKSAFVTIAVYNSLGQEISRLTNEQQVAGVHRISFNGSGLASGIYYFRISAGELSRTQQMVLIK